MIGMMLLTQTDEYLVNGRLPLRPRGDQEFLYGSWIGKYVLCSENTAKSLPSDLWYTTLGIIHEIPSYIPRDNVINVGVSTFDKYKPEMLYIVRSTEETFVTETGKIFRYREDYTYQTTIQLKVNGFKYEIWSLNEPVIQVDLNPKPLTGRERKELIQKVVLGDLDRHKPGLITEDTLAVMSSDKSQSTTSILSGFNALCKEHSSNMREKGFWELEDKYSEDDTLQSALNITRLSLISTEISEAIDAIRTSKYGYEQKDTFEDELADTLIRFMDLIGGLDIDIERQVNWKMNYNKERKHRHGKVL